METTDQTRRRALASDGGFTMMEVMVALAIIAIVASASLAFFVQGTRSVTTQQRQQNAVAVANHAMEVAYSRVATASDTGTSGLVVGRTEAEVKAAWNAAVSDGVAGLSDAYPAWDVATTPAPEVGTEDDKVPLTDSVTESRIDYTVTTLIGSCYRVKVTPTAACTKTGGDAAGVPLAGYARIMRSVVVVTWADVAGTCGGICRYDVSALIDPNTDLEWNNTTRLLAADDSVAVDADKVAVIDVLDNDTLMEITANPVALVSSPVKAGTTIPMGTATVNPSNGFITYDPSDDAHGEVTFVYSVTVGARTASATVHVYVKPFAHNYSATAVVATGTATIPVKTISGDTPTQITVLSTPSKGSVSVSGTSFRYTPVLAGTYSFTYTYTDSEGMVSLPGTVTMTVSTFVAPAVTDLAYPKTAGTFLAAASGTEFTLDLRADTNNAAGYKTSVQTLPGGGVLKAGGTTIGAATPASPFITTQPLKWTAPNNSAGTWRFNYKIVSPDDERSSDTKMVTVTVMPVANPQTISVARNTTKNPKPQLTGIPTSGLTYTKVSSPNCATADITTTGVVTVKGGSTRKTCTFTYNVRTTGTPVLTSANATVTITVT